MSGPALCFLAFVAFLILAARVCLRRDEHASDGSAGFRDPARPRD